MPTLSWKYWPDRVQTARRLRRRGTERFDHSEIDGDVSDRNERLFNQRYRAARLAAKQDRRPFPSYAKARRDPIAFMTQFA